MPETEEARAPAAAHTLPPFTPVPRLKDRTNGWKPEVQRAFIEALAETGSVKSAAARVGRAEVGAYLLRRHPEAQQFCEAWDAALDIGMRRIEDVAMDRALNGVEVPMYAYGKLVGTRRIYNDRLLMFMLRNRAPTRFAADSHRNADAATKSQLDRLKREWRKEWEAEAAARRAASSEEVIQSLNARLETMRQRQLAGMTTRTRALWEAWQEAEAEDRAAGRSAWSEAWEEDAGEDADEDADRDAESPDDNAAAPPGEADPVEPGSPRALPRLLTHGDDGLGVPRKGGVW